MLAHLQRFFPRGKVWIFLVCDFNVFEDIRDVEGILTVRDGNDIVVDAKVTVTRSA